MTDNNQKVFGTYSKYYDLLYKDKPYQQEVDFIDQVIKKQAQKASTLLDLGCGTGKHDFLLAKKGYSVTGVDLSDAMLLKANEELKEYSKPNKPVFYHGDMRTFSLEQKFDVITSLFHVVSYLTNNDDILTTFINIKNHLKPSGVFLFDSWYGPAVLSNFHPLNVRSLDNKDISLTRISKSAIEHLTNTVKVHYTLSVYDKTSAAFSRTEETHTMRYFFKPEIEAMLGQAGFSLVDSFEWLTHKPLEINTFGSCFIAKVK